MGDDADNSREREKKNSNEDVSETGKELQARCDEPEATKDADGEEKKRHGEMVDPAQVGDHSVGRQEEQEGEVGVEQAEVVALMAMAGKVEEAELTKKKSQEGGSDHDDNDSDDKEGDDADDDGGGGGDKVQRVHRGGLGKQQRRS